MIEVDVMFPVMVTDELDKIKRYYETVFAFESVFYDPEFYLHLKSPNGAVQLGFLRSAHASQPEFLQRDMQREGYVISFEVRDAEQAYRLAQAQQLELAMPLKDEVWGQRHFILKDPAGFYVDVVQHQEVAA